MAKKEKALGTDFFIVLQIAASFFTNLGAGYFFILIVSRTVWDLISNVLFCIVCLYAAYSSKKFASNI